jgi:hypothetical protein
VFCNTSFTVLYSSAHVKVGDGDMPMLCCSLDPRTGLWTIDHAWAMANPVCPVRHHSSAATRKKRAQHCRVQLHLHGPPGCSHLLWCHQTCFVSFGTHYRYSSPSLTHTTPSVQGTCKRCRRILGAARRLRVGMRSRVTGTRAPKAPAQRL